MKTPIKILNTISLPAGKVGITTTVDIYKYGVMLTQKQGNFTDKVFLTTDQLKKLNTYTS